MNRHDISILTRTSSWSWRTERSTRTRSS